MTEFDDDEDENSAGALLLEAACLTTEGRGHSELGTALVEHVRAKLADPATGSGNELIQSGNGGGVSTFLLRSLDHPDLLAAEASERRLRLAKRSGALTLALDMADTIQGKNSAEQMLAHQLAAAHTGIMRLSGQLNNLFTHDLAGCSDAENLRAGRLAGSIARLMGAYQQGLLTLQRLRSGGKQTVIVQHVQVNEGGQAPRRWQDEGHGGSRFAQISGGERRKSSGQAREGEGVKLSSTPQARIMRERLKLANASPRCGAKRRDGEPCRGAAMVNGRCRMHGGRSTGPRPAEGKARIAAAAFRHGYYTAEAKRERAEARAAYRGSASDARGWPVRKRIGGGVREALKRNYKPIMKPF